MGLHPYGDCQPVHAIMDCHLSDINKEMQTFSKETKDKLFGKSLQ